MTDDPTDASANPAPGDATAPGETEAETVAYAPTPERRPEWARPAWTDSVVEATPADPLADPLAVAAPIAPVEPVEPVRGEPRRSGGGVGTIIAAAVLSAILASGGTVALLKTTGALDHTAGGSAQVTSTQRPLAIDESSAVVDAAANVSPAVVRILASGVSRDVFGGVLPETGVGSGVIYDADGWILTNRHVVLTNERAIASSLTVELKDGREFTGTVYGIDTLTDLAIVKVDASGLPAAPIGKSADIKVGQLAIAIGSPLGTYTSTVTTGIISATGRTLLVDASTRLSNLIQTDAAINPGNSGGPLLDASGAVIGINTAVEPGSTGIGFAIPIDIARPIMAQALAGEPLARPYVGIRYRQIDAKLKEEKGLTVDAGALIGPSTNARGETLPGIAPGGPAEAAGLKDADIIVRIEDQLIDAEHPLDAVLTSYGPGQVVKMIVLRAGTEMTVSVTLGTRPEGL
jgi:serine protease Do